MKPATPKKIDWDAAGEAVEKAQRSVANVFWELAGDEINPNFECRSHKNVVSPESPFWRSGSLHMAIEEANIKRTDKPSQLQGVVKSKNSISAEGSERNRKYHGIFKNMVSSSVKNVWAPGLNHPVVLFPIR